MDQESLGLFPLHAVLLPGGALGLRVFEARYLDLVRTCGREGTGFGVCLIIEGEEAGAAASPAAFGTEARIEDFGHDEGGLLTLQVRGHRRFHVRRTRVRDSGLVVAEIDWCDPDSDDELRPEHAVLGTLLQRLFEQVGGEHASAGPSQLDSASWISWRLIELLPLSNLQRQAALQEDDPHIRLQHLLDWISLPS